MTQQSIDGKNRYIIMGKPIACARPKFTGNRAYDTQKREKLAAGLIIKKQHGNVLFFQGALHLSITFFMPIPKGTKRNLWHSKKPDLSNLIKFYEDVCTGILYADDKQIVKITAGKIYDQHPRTEFIITEL